MIKDIKKYILNRILIKDNGCWEYPYCLTKSGYARVRQKRAHRISYEIFKGKIPEGLVIDHLCKNKICINPNHLEAVTDRTNILRGNGLAAMNIKKTHCKNGHPYSGDNLKIWKRERLCKICVSNNQKKYYKKKYKQESL